MSKERMVKIRKRMANKQRREVVLPDPIENEKMRRIEKVQFRTEKYRRQYKSSGHC